ncbi:hypothetical protein [Streptococcus tangpeifui]|uniref:hypothetical protein n=1 Tax=Streptococcus tangpeifui TaxID=2709400 RepID=UPI0013EB6A0E|nr:hypothetical protein [Streptococcus sp. ZJ373]
MTPNQFNQEREEQDFSNPIWTSGRDHFQERYSDLNPPTLSKQDSLRTLSFRQNRSKVPGLFTTIVAIMTAILLLLILLGIIFSSAINNVVLGLTTIVLVFTYMPATIILSILGIVKASQYNRCGIESYSASLVSNVVFLIINGLLWFFFLILVIEGIRS